MDASLNRENDSLEQLTMQLFCFAVNDMTAQNWIVLAKFEAVCVIAPVLLAKIHV
jgi:hypothetical protein